MSKLKNLEEELAMAAASLERAKEKLKNEFRIHLVNQKRIKPNDKIQIEIDLENEYIRWRVL